ncbi:MAG: zinc dependent phospholipase C family protein [Clostridia bacterium]|jgi:phospholipase C
MGVGERTYGGMTRFVLAALNPFKKATVHTECKIHRQMNKQALRILHNEGYQEAYVFYGKHKEILDKGAVWADQDFKSLQHFYHPYRKKGIYGQKNARQLAEEYYFKAIRSYYLGRVERAVFFLGAVAHLIQDMTIPQHANIRLLSNHRKYETFVKHFYNSTHDVKAEKGIIEFDELREYIQFNSRTALKMHRLYGGIGDRKERFYRIAKCSIPLAERTTAGFLLMFYKRHVLGQELAFSKKRSVSKNMG